MIVSEYFFRKKFRSVKVLRSHIEKLPIPYADMETQNEIISLSEQIMALSRNDMETRNELSDTTEAIKELYKE